MRLFLKICEAVSYAHQRGVIHRDFKPSDIVVQDLWAKGYEGHGLPDVGGDVRGDDNSLHRSDQRAWEKGRRSRNKTSLSPSRASYDDGLSSSHGNGSASYSHSSVITSTHARLPEVKILDFGLARMCRGHCCLEVGQLTEAESDLLPAHEVLADTFSPDHRHLQRLCANLVRVYEATGRTTEAARWREQIVPAE